MITSKNRTDLFYGSQRIRSRYLGGNLIWGDNLGTVGDDSGTQTVSFSNIYLYYQPNPYSFYNYTVAQLNLDSSDAQLIRGKNIVSVELDGKKSDVKWAFPTSGSSLIESYLAVESTSTTFTQVQNKIKSDYGISAHKYVDSVVIHYTV